MILFTRFLYYYSLLHTFFFRFAIEMSFEGDRAMGIVGKEFGRCDDFAKYSI